MKFNCTDPLTLQNTIDRTTCTLFYNYGELKHEFTATSSGLTNLENLGLASAADVTLLDNTGWAASSVTVDTGTEKCTESSESMPKMIVAATTAMGTAWFF